MDRIEVVGVLGSKPRGGSAHRHGRPRRARIGAARRCASLARVWGGAHRTPRHGRGGWHCACTDAAAAERTPSECKRARTVRINLSCI